MELRLPLEGILRDLGFEVFGTDNGKHAVLMQYHEPFDLLVLHWNNKELSGDKVMAAMVLLCDSLPKVIVMSGQDVISFHFSIPVSSFLFKPFGSDRVIKAVWTALGEEPQHA
jgi:DNA-binding NtrC family response regulator